MLLICVLGAEWVFGVVFSVVFGVVLGVDSGFFSAGLGTST